MAVKDVGRDAVEDAVGEFRRTGLEAMLAKYGGGPSTKWYLEVGSARYDQKLVVRAAHVLQGLGPLPPLVPGDFTAGQSRHRLERLGYRVGPRLRQTDENLKGPSATEPLARWLIGAARQFTTLAYSDAASRLEQECGFSRIFPASQMGKTVAAFQYAIHARAPSAPLLNVLLVLKDTGLPSSGAQDFLAARFPEEPRLAEDDADTVHPALWARYARRAITEAHDYPGWEALYEQFFGRYVPDPFYAPPARGRGKKRGGTGEGPNHRALRKWVKDHPRRVAKRLRDVKADTEVELRSADRVDVVYETPREVLAIEVKSRDSNWADLRRGVYQCVKYGAVVQAQEKEASGRAVRSLLVTESPLPADLEQTARRLGVAHLQVDPARR